METETNNTEARKKEIYTYKAAWPTYGMAWSRGSAREDLFRMILSSFKEEYSNKIEILRLHRDAHSRGPAFEKLGEFDHPYPATKVMWCPPSEGGSAIQQDLIATSGDYLRLWDVNSVTNQVEMRALLNNNRHT
eukprot:gene11619-24323_t